MEFNTLPLHPAQLDVYLDQVINPDSPHYNIGGYMKICGPLNKDVFTAAVNSVVNVFDALNARFDLNDDEPVCY